MRIILVNKYWYGRAGAETVVLMTKKLLESAGHQVEVFGMNHPLNLFSNKYFVDFVDYDNMSIWQKPKFGLRSIYNFQAKKNFLELIKDFKPDVIHFHNIYHQLSCSIIEAAHEQNIKTVMTLHDYKFISPNYSLFNHGRIDESCSGGNYYRCILNNCLGNFGESLMATIEAYFVDAKGFKKMIHTYISPSKFLMDKFIKAGFDAKNILQISNALPADEFKMSHGDLGYVAYVGRLSSEKGLKYLLASAEILSDIHFKIVGSGPELMQLESKVNEKKLTNVEFVGQKTGAELESLITGARLLVLPSIWYENAPLSILEAKARGKIVVASDIGGISEMLPKELLVVPADHMALTNKIKAWFEKDDSTRQAMAERLYGQVNEENRPEIYLQKILKVYSENE